MTDDVSEMPLQLRDARPEDADAMAAIYNHYILNSTATFEETVVSSREFQERLDLVREYGLPWLVAGCDSKVAGYAYATRWRARAAYRFSVEVSAYVAHDGRSNGIGSALYDALLPSLKGLGVNAVISGITLPNDPSVAFHEKYGMQKVAHFERVGFKFDQWLDVGYWQMQLRSGPGQT